MNDMNEQEYILTNNEGAQQFQIPIDGKLALIRYTRKDDKIYLMHTEVPEALSGRGIAGMMAEKVFRYIEEKNWILVPLCTYIQAYLKRHPEWERLLEKGD